MMVENSAIEPNLFDIVIVCYEREIELLELQFRSLDLYFSPVGLGRVIVIWNGAETTAQVEEKFGIRLRMQLGKFADKLLLTSKYDICSSSKVENEAGWISQQVLKLEVATIVETPHYCVLDAKNHFIRSASARDFFDESGKPITQSFDYGRAKQFKVCLLNSLAYFGVEATDVLIRASLPTTTPMLINTGLVRDLMKMVTARSGLAFADAFLSPPLGRDTTEFILYGAYVSSLGPLDRFYTFRPPRHITFFSTAPSSEKGAADAVARLKDDDINMFGLHRARIGRLTEEQKAAFCSMWVEHKLFPDRDAATKFIVDHA